MKRLTHGETAAHLTHFKSPVGHPQFTWCSGHSCRSEPSKQVDGSRSRPSGVCRSSVWTWVRRTGTRSLPVLVEESCVSFQGACARNPSDCFRGARSGHLVSPRFLLRGRRGPRASSSSGSRGSGPCGRQDTTRAQPGGDGVGTPLLPCEESVCPSPRPCGELTVTGERLTRGVGRFEFTTETVPGQSSARVRSRATRCGAGIPQGQG